MKKIIFVMLAVFAFSVAMTATASAEITLLAEWLLNNAPITVLTSVELMSPALTLTDTKTIAGEASVLCEAIPVGTVGANGESETTEILNLKEEKVSELGTIALLGTEAASGEGSECKTVKLCAAGSAASPIEVNPIGLPWHDLLFLMESGAILDLVYSETGEKVVGYELLCLVLGLNTEDKCTSADFEVEVVNDPENAAFPAGAETSPPALCTQSKEETGLNITDNLVEILDLEVGTLSVSSE